MLRLIWFLAVLLVFTGVLSEHAVFAEEEEPVAEAESSVLLADEEQIDPEASQELQQVQAQAPQTPQIPPTTLEPAPPPAPEAAQSLREQITGPSAPLRGPTTDTGSLIDKLNILGIATQRRTPIVNESILRGTRTGQRLANGSFWIPARQDLDTALSKLDSSLIREVLIFKGPYTAIFGPGFTFIDTQLANSPRFTNGWSWEGQTRVNYLTNGKQWFGGQTLLTGSSNWGLRVDYDHRTGNDYETGGDILKIPASYNSRNFFAAFGYDLSPDRTLEVNYLRLDQTGVEFPGQAFDINFLNTNAFEVHYLDRNFGPFDQLAVEGWYNRTAYDGNSQRTAKRQQNPILDNFQFFGLTGVSLMSTGYTLALEKCFNNCSKLTIGSDLRFLRQEINEINRFRATNFFPGADPNFNPFVIPSTTATAPGVGLAVFPLYFLTADKRVPQSHFTNPGLFAELELAASERLRFRTGGRIDWAASQVVDNRPIQEVLLPGLFFAPDVLVNPDQLQPLIPLVPGPTVVPSQVLRDREFPLGMLFLTSEYDLNEHWTATSGLGFSMRSPTLTELYSFNGPFLAILQRGGNFVFGNENLAPAKLMQIDVGMQTCYERLRGGANFFYGWVNDFITLRQLIPQVLFFPEGESVQLVQFVNTDWATLVGGEAYLEFDVTPWLTGFARMSYVQGTDLTRGQSGVSPPRIFPLFPSVAVPVPDEEPLPGIPPLESRLGVVIHQPGPNPCWGIELSVRAVDGQDRFAASLGEKPTAGFSVWDLHGYWQASDQLTLTVGVENFTDRFYREHLDIRQGVGVFQPGLSFYFGGEYRFGPGGNTPSFSAEPPPIG
jgi:iron complex outermembrane receptor protein